MEGCNMVSWLLDPGQLMTFTGQMSCHLNCRPVKSEPV